MKCLSTILRLAARRALFKYVQEFVDRENLPAKKWPAYVRNELLKHVEIELGTPDVLPRQQGRILQLEKELKSVPEEKRTEFLKEKKINVSPRRYRTPSSLPSKPGPESLSKYKDLIDEFMWDYGSAPQVVNIRTDLSDFDAETKKHLPVRMEHTVDVRQDVKRHEVQKKIFQEKKELINDEPVILKEISGKYHLTEGWHRTAQLIKEARKRGMKQVPLKAYIGRQSMKYKAEKLVQKLWDFLNTPVSG